MYSYILFEWAYPHALFPRTDTCSSLDIGQKGPAEEAKSGRLEVTDLRLDVDVKQRS